MIPTSGLARLWRLDSRTQVEPNLNLGLFSVSSERSLAMQVGSCLFQNKTPLAAFASDAERERERERRKESFFGPHLQRNQSFCFPDGAVVASVGQADLPPPNGFEGWL